MAGRGLRESWHVQGYVVTVPSGDLIQQLTQTDMMTTQRPLKHGLWGTENWEYGSQRGVSSWRVCQGVVQGELSHSRHTGLRLVKRGVLADGMSYRNWDLEGARMWTLLVSSQVLWKPDASWNLWFVLHIGYHLSLFLLFPFPFSCSFLISLMWSYFRIGGWHTAFPSLYAKLFVNLPCDV